MQSAKIFQCTSPLNRSYVNNQMLLLFKQGLYMLGLFSQCLSPACSKKLNVGVPYTDTEGLLWVLSTAVGKRQICHQSKYRYFNTMHTEYIQLFPISWGLWKEFIMCKEEWKCFLVRGSICTMWSSDTFVGTTESLVQHARLYKLTQLEILPEMLH